MNIKEFIMPAIIALALTIGIQYFFLNKKKEVFEGVKTGQSFIAPRTMSEAKPLNLEINFSDIQAEHLPVKTVVETPYATLTFSEEGASLERLNFKEHAHSTPTVISTIGFNEQANREERCFLVALNTLTPYYYRLINEHKTDMGIELVYQADIKQAVVQKKFLIHDNKHQIDLTITAIPLAGSALDVRVMYPSPFMQEITKWDSYSALVINESNTLEKSAYKKIDSRRGWFAPVVFGAENKYFIHAMVHDSNHFVQRAYYKLACNSIVSILEGPAIKEETSWTMSFYMGPKTEHAIAQVDSRLEGALEYSGWLAPLSRLLLYLLKFLHHYVRNYGVAIILLIAGIKLLLIPFSVNGKKDRKKQEEYQKKLAYIRAKYKNDPEMLAREQANLLREQGLPGLGSMMTGLLQLPLFIALNRVLAGSIEMYKAPFLWVSDLSNYDPYYILPLLITMSLFVNALFGDSKQRISLLVLGLILGAISSSWSAGLALFILVNTGMNALQSALQK
ncbi:MAG: membrane protein insertase YidC [Candidatus Dependentiae bacterium]|nr:membrane protein insertase YidC [Candidatus Dependentiae bacterium]